MHVFWSKEKKKRKKRNKQTRANARFRGVETERFIEGPLSVSLSLGFLGHVRRARAKKPLTPEVFNSVHLIEAYLDYLKVGHFSAAPFLPSLVLTFDTEFQARLDIR